MQLLQTVLFLLVLGLPYSSHATAQFSDQFHYRGNRYSVIGRVGKLPTPQDFGMVPEAFSTANWRGFVSEYAIRDGQLYLVKMTVSVSDHKYRPINGVEPSEEDLALGSTYENVNLPLKFSGKFRLGRDFIEEFYVHMGFQKPSAFREVHDLQFKDGKLIKELDRSSEAAAIRGQFQKAISEMSADQVVEEAFSLDMEKLQ